MTIDSFGRDFSPEPFPFSFYGKVVPAVNGFRGLFFLNEKVLGETKVYESRELAAQNLRDVVEGTFIRALSA